MRPQPVTASSVSAGTPARRGLSSPGTVDDVDLDIPILGRDDVAAVPWIVICAGSFALALSQALRPAGDTSWAHANLLIIAGSLLFGCGAGLMIALQESEVFRRLRGEVWIYLLSAGSLLTSLTVVALADRGLASVALMAMPFTTAYLGLVMPPRWSRISIAVVMATLVGIQLVRPDAELLEWASVFALVAAGGAIGLVVRHSHQEAWTQSLLLSRSDQLTGVLNRRGFLEQLADELRTADRPLALLLIDLNDFKRVNDTGGHPAGDALLTWVAARITDQIPGDAALGRLGGDEFAVVLPGATHETATRTGDAIVRAISARISAAVGGAICAPADVTDVSAVLQHADTALYAAKRDPGHPVQLQPGALAAPRPTGCVDEPRPAALTFAELRAAGGPPQRFASTLYEGRIIALGFLIIAAAGTPFVASTIFGGGASFFELVIQYLGPPWILANLVISAVYVGKRFENDRPPLFAFYSSAILLAVGISAAALSTGNGAVAPITAGLLIKVFFDCALAPRALALKALAIIAAFWAAMLAFGPADALWAAPYQVVLLVGGYLFGTIGQRAFAEATAIRLRLANTDGLTGLLNRRGFEDAVDAAREDGRAEGLAVLTFDLDAFKQVNDTLGHAAGDEVLRAVAQATQDALPEALAIGRLGGDEFVAAVTAGSLERAVLLADRLDAHLTAVAPGSVGCAIHPADGTTLDELLITADQRAYAVKRTRGQRRGD